MKGTEQFKQTIKAYLDERAKRDELFAVSYAKENKNLDDCITFVLNQANSIDPMLFFKLIEDIRQNCGTA